MYLYIEIIVVVLSIIGQGEDYCCEAESSEDDRVSIGQPEGFRRASS